MSHSLIAATGTPLATDESLHVESLEMHLHDLWGAGLTGILVGGTMGTMQLLTERTYRSLIEYSIQFSAGRGEVMVGVGDAGFARTKERIELANTTRCDAVVVLSPYLFRFTQAQLVDYFTALANISRRPLFLYDLPGLTGIKLELETVETLAGHPNISGIKCSGELGWTRELIDRDLPNFRVIVAQPDVIDVLMHHGVREHLDGVFSMAPRWTAAIIDAAEREDWTEAAACQKRLSKALRVLKTYGVFPTFTAIMNARGFPGKYAPAPFPELDESVREQVLSLPIIEDLIRDCPVSRSRRDGVMKELRSRGAAAANARYSPNTDNG